MPPEAQRLIWNLAILAAIVWLSATNAPVVCIGGLLALLHRELPVTQRS
jgi:hypothetical protein